MRVDIGIGRNGVVAVQPSLRADKVRKLVAGSEHGGRADVGSSGAWRTEWPWLSTSSPQAWKALGRREYYLARTKLD